MTNQTRWPEVTDQGPRATMARFRRRLRANERALWGLVLLALLLDFGLTVYGFQLGFVEQNEVGRWLLSTYGIAGILGLKLAALALALGLRQLLPPGYRGIVPLALAVPWWIGAIANAVQIAATL